MLLFVLCISLIGLIRAADAFSLADRMRALVSGGARVRLVHDLEVRLVSGAPERVSGFG